MPSATERSRKAAKSRALPPPLPLFSAACAAACAVLFLLFASAAQAEDGSAPPRAHATPAIVRRSGATARVRTVVYEAGAVIPIVVHSFRVALIEFAPEERIQTVRIGDGEGWEVNDAGSRLFLKPRLEGVTSNLLVITDRHTYVFDLESRREGDRIRETTYDLRFLYPEEERARTAARKEEEEQRQQALVASGRNMDPARMNFRYAFAGERQLVPELLFDDGEFTYFRFRNPRDLPAIFVVNEKKEESLANYGIEGDYVVVHRTAAQFSLRDGQSLACIFNENEGRHRPAPPVNGPHERMAEDDGPPLKRPGHYVSKPGPGWRPAPR